MHCTSYVRTLVRVGNASKVVIRAIVATEWLGGWPGLSGPGSGSTGRQRPRACYRMTYRTEHVVFFIHIIPYTGPRGKCVSNVDKCAPYGSLIDQRFPFPCSGFYASRKSAAKASLLQAKVKRRTAQCNHIKSGFVHADHVKLTDLSLGLAKRPILL